MKLIGFLIIALVGIASARKSVPTQTNSKDKVTGKWVWKYDSKHFLLNKEKSKVWEEHLGTKILHKYVQKENLGKDGIILFDKTRHVYANVTDKLIYLYKNLDDLKQGKFRSKSSGSWIVKPKINKKQKPTSRVTGKWVWANDNKHYLLNKGNSKLWQEFKNHKVVSNYTVKRESNAKGGLILYNQALKQYARVLDHRIFFHNNLEKLKEGKSIKKAIGHWLVKPGTSTSTSTPRPTTKTTTVCPNIVRCLRDPCDGKKCENFPRAECRANYCGGCNYDFYLNGFPIKKSRC